MSGPDGEVRHLPRWRARLGVTLIYLGLGLCAAVLAVCVWRPSWAIAGDGRCAPYSGDALSGRCRVSARPKALEYLLVPTLAGGFVLAVTGSVVYDPGHGSGWCSPDCQAAECDRRAAARQSRVGGAEARGGAR